MRGACLFAIAVASVVSVSPGRFARNSFAAYDDVQQVFGFLADTLPADLREASVQRQAWPAWVSAHDREIRGRLLQGDEDTIVNWLLFGTSFTSEPRALFEVSANSKEIGGLISRRARDLIVSVRSAHPDERSLFARRLFSNEGYGFDSAQEKARLQQHLEDEAKRVLDERRQYAEREDSFETGDFADRMIVQSHLFRDRGLSLDTSILPSFAIEQSLETMKSQGFIPPKAVRRIAVIGPGLDFADKSSGYDFYPVQTLQPFATLDSLLRLGLAADPGNFEVTTFDISARVNDHIARLTARAKAGAGYVLRLPLDLRAPWTPSLVSYWKRLGDRIRSESAAPRPPDIKKGVEIRTVEVRPQIAAIVTAEDLNIVTERWRGAPFDLVVATNVFVYYDKLDQSLAFAGVEAMLRPGGFFLTNNAIVELPVSRLRSLQFVTVRHSNDMTDHVFLYRRNQ